MAMPLSRCPERMELEDRVNECLEALNRTVRQASRYVGEQATERMFHTQETVDAQETARLETLQECLRLHRRCHGC